MRLKNHITAISIVLIFLASLAWMAVFSPAIRKSATPLPPSIAPPFEYYGWVYVGYTENTHDLQRMLTYTNTAFAIAPEQAKILAPLGFKHIIFMLNESTILERLAQNANLTLPQASQTAIFYQDLLPDFREKFFTAYRDYLQQLKNELLEADVYDAIDVFYIADEPALHRNIYLDQEFLNQYADEFKQAFPDKKSTMSFAQMTDPAASQSRPESGPHLNPPLGLDIITVDPYFPDPIFEQSLSCDMEIIKNWLYAGNPLSNIDWAKQFDKTILVVGDAQIRAWQSPKDCYVTATYQLLQEDPQIAGLVWFIYDKEYNEMHYITGAANNPRLVELIENLGQK